MQASSRCGLGNGDLADDAEEAGSTAFGTARHATSRDSLERPLGTPIRPQRLFPFIYGSPRASVDAKPYPAVLQSSAQSQFPPAPPR